ncbi:MAG: hypothetical protein ACR2MM_09980 [Flavobacteriaceae bacterium]
MDSIPILFVSIVLGCWLIPVSLLSQDRDFLMSNPNSFHDREAVFPDLSFDIGETQLIESAYPESFFPLLIPTFEGIPRLGNINDYGTGNPELRTAIYETSQERRAVTEELKHNLGCYLSLLCLQINAAEFSTENLMFYETKGSGYGEEYYTFDRQIDMKLHYTVTPRFHMEGMAAGTLTKEKYMEYYCPSREQCSEGYRQRQGRIWAGPQANEFKKRAAYKKFVDTEVPKLLDWSSNLGREVALVGVTVLPTYNFQKNGFEIYIVPVKASGTVHAQDLQFWPRNPESSSFKLNEGFGKNILLSIPPDKAEAMINRLKTEYSQRTRQILYTVMIAEIYSSGPTRRGASHSAFGGNVGYVYDYKDTRIRFFLDPDLTELVYETKL